MLCERTLSPSRSWSRRMKVTTPFVMSLFPSERAKAAGAPVEVDISKLEPGQKIITGAVGRFPARAGQTWRSEFSGVGTVEVRFV